MAAPRVVSDHHGPWTVADVLALPHDEKRGRAAELPAVLLRELDDSGTHTLTRTLGAGELATTTEPFAVAFDPAELPRPMSG